MLSGSWPSSGCTGTAPSACASLSSVTQLCLYPIPDPVPYRAEDGQALLLGALAPGKNGHASFASSQTVIA